jgi:serine/threonine protein kinase
LSSQLDNAFDQVSTVDIEDLPFGGGGFGEVYHCNSINGGAVNTAQVIKILVDNGSGSARQGFNTIQKLQRKIIQKNTELQQDQKKPIQDINALYALPQFSFQGTINGKQVLGYSINRLDTKGYIEFERVFEDQDLFRKYHALDLDEKLMLAYDLVEGFQLLKEISFIHADINPQNLFINLEDRHLTIIDFDSGAVTENPSDKPSTFGKPNEWLAPEILEQLKNTQGLVNTVKVDLLTDTWSVAVGIHHLIFLAHPLFYLKDLSIGTINSYFKTSNYEWPDIDPADRNYRAEIPVQQYEKYVNSLLSLPATIREKLSSTINQGYLNPNLRTNYNQWIAILKDSQKPPVINYFQSDKISIIEGIPVTLEWSVSNAHTVTIDNEVGEVGSDGLISLTPTHTTQYALRAEGHFGIAEGNAYVRVWPAPTIRSLFVPAPAVSQKLILRNVSIHSPNVYIPVNLSLPISIRYSNFANTTQGLLKNAATRLKKAAPKHTLIMEPNSLNQVFRHIKARIKKRLKSIGL